MEDMGEKTGLDVDFLVEVFVEKVPSGGEDAYTYLLGDQTNTVGVFDGCGGSGARGYRRAGGKTGAYLAARVASGAVRDWAASGEASSGPNAAVAMLKARVRRYLKTCKDAVDEASAMRGGLAKELPTTCAVLTLSEGDVRSLWAGDSRCYLLDAEGLHQLTRDDVDGFDAYENLRADGALTNVISASQQLDIHVNWMPLDHPCVVFAATDGCFGYLTTPMEFEYLLLRTLAEAMSPLDWEARLGAAFDAVAGDDATLCGLSLGFGSFATLKDALAPRLAELRSTYMDGLDEKDEDERRALWDRYKVAYCAMMDRCGDLQLVDGEYVEVAPRDE